MSEPWQSISVPALESVHPQFEVKVDLQGRMLALACGLSSPVLLAWLFSMVPKPLPLPIPSKVIAVLLDEPSAPSALPRSGKPEVVVKPTSDGAREDLPSMLATAIQRPMPIPAADLPPADMPLPPLPSEAATPAPLPSRGTSPSAPGRHPGQGEQRPQNEGSEGQGSGHSNMIRRSSIRHPGSVDIDLERIGITMRILPGYPPDCLRSKIQGTVVMNILMDERGVPVRWKVVESSDRSFSQVVEEVIPDWRFSPVMVEGRTVKVAFDLVFTFIIPELSRAPKVTRHSKGRVQ